MLVCLLHSSLDYLHVVLVNIDKQSKCCCFYWFPLLIMTIYELISLWYCNWIT